MTPPRLLLTGLGLLLLAFVLLTSSPPASAPPSAVSLRSWLVLTSTLVGRGLVVAAGLVSALTADRSTAAAEPAVDHYS